MIIYQPNDKVKSNEKEKSNESEFENIRLSDKLLAPSVRGSTSVVTQSLQAHHPNLLI